MIMNTKQQKIPDCTKGKIEPRHIHVCTCTFININTLTYPIDFGRVVRLFD